MSSRAWLEAFRLTGNSFIITVIPLSGTIVSDGTVTTDGAFTKDGTFIPLPKISAEPFQKIWEEKVFQLLLSENKIQQALIDDMRNWRHSGFRNWK